MNQPPPPPQTHQTLSLESLEALESSGGLDPLPPKKSNPLVIVLIVIGSVLVVMILLGILSTIAGVSFGDLSSDAEESARITTERTLMSAVQVYIAMNQAQAVPTLAQLKAANLFVLDESQWTVTIGGTVSEPTVSVTAADG